MNMLAAAKMGLKGLGVDTRAIYQNLSADCIKSAIRSQGLSTLCDRLREIIPDISDQYTGGLDPVEYKRYWEVKMRGLHAFQIRCAIDAIELVGGEGLVIADIGDSSGNHGAYLKALMEPGRLERVISVNLDPVAVEKVRAKGGDAIHCRAENLDAEGIKAHLFMSFETVEHLTDPVSFLHSLAAGGGAEYFLMTVPYRRESRFGGDLLRMENSKMPSRLTAEQVHIFELCPDDWSLLAHFAGYTVIFSNTYLQYPSLSPYRLMQPVWRNLDHEGFLALFLKRDLSLANRYVDW
jgi:hypothetical protein